MSAKYYGTEKVGETFEYNGNKYKVEETEKKHQCLGCVFDNEDVLGCNEMACIPFFRDDERSVVYQEVK